MDIIERLAQWAENDMKAEVIALEARYEIERLRKELIKSYQQGVKTVNDLVTQRQGMANEIERLRKELKEKKCSCQKREDDINEMFSEWNGED